MNHHLREIADCLDEALRLQSRVMDLTEQVYEAAGMSPGDRTLRGKVTGLFFGLQAPPGGAQSPGPRRRLKPPLPPRSLDGVHRGWPRVGSRSAERDLTS